MTGRHIAAACLVERGQEVCIELASGFVMEGRVRARRNTQRQSALGRTMLLTHIYFEDGDKQTVHQLHRVTITKEANG